MLDRLRYTCLMILCFLTFVSIYGKDQDLLSPCEVELKVKRRTAYLTAPEQSLQLKCPVKHCGKSLNITWCKVGDTLNRGFCDQVNQTDNVEITQIYNKDTLISFLTFKRISIYDDGLYSCNYIHEVFSHTINISVSDLYQGQKHLENPAAEYMSSPNPPNLPLSWLPYFYICIGIALLVAILTVLTHISSHGWKRTLQYKSTNGQEMSTSMIPDLPRSSDPTPPVLQNKFSVLNDIYCPSTAGTLLSPPFHITNGNQPLSNDSRVSDCAVYAVINHRQSILPVRQQHTATKDQTRPEYATINVS